MQRYCRLKSADGKCGGLLGSAYQEKRLMICRIAIPAALSRPRLYGVLLVCASLGLIVLITLSPFDFSCSDTSFRTDRPTLQIGWGKSSVSDVLLNAGLFMPFGFGLARLLTWRRRLTGLKSLAVVFGVCFAVAYTIEVLQQLMPSRYPALRDALANSFGGVLGWSGLQSLVRWRSRRPREDSRA
jgi:VanZ like family